MSERTVFQSIPHRHVVSLPPQASVWDAACVMTKANCGSVLIIDGAGVMLGILTERDLMTRVLTKSLNASTTPVSDVMTQHPLCVLPEMTVSDAVLILLERGFRHLPIVSAAGKILGVFSIRDALPREIDSAVGQAEFRDSVNDALG